MPKAGFAEWNEDDAFDLDDERPSGHARKRRLPWLRMMVLSALCVAGLVHLAQEGERNAPLAVPAAPAPRPILTAPTPVWRPIAPFPVLYAFERNADPVALKARQHASGAREDTLILGGFGDTRHAHIALVHGPARESAGPLAEPVRSFFIDLVRRSAEAGLSVVRYGQSHMVASKFGPVEAASVILAGAAEQTCHGFRFADPAAGFGFQGWLCGSESSPVGDAQLACFLDGIGVTGAAAPGLKAVFAASERNRIEACGSGARTASANVRAPVRQ